MTVSQRAADFLDSLCFGESRTMLASDLYAEQKEYNSWLLEDSKIVESISSISSGAAFRTVHRDFPCSSISFRSGANISRALSCVNELRNDDVAKRPAAYFSGTGDDAIFDEREPLPNEFPSILRDIDAMLRSASTLVRQVTLRFDTGTKEKLVYPENRCIRNETTTGTSFSIHVTVSDENGAQTASDLVASAAGQTRFLRDNDLSLRAVIVLERAVALLRAPKCPAGHFPVLLSGRTGGTMIHEACGHGLEADIVMKDFSTFRDRIGTSVASPEVSIVDDPTLPSVFGGYRFDDEGTEAQRTLLIDKGVLVTYLTDRDTSARTHLPLSGNGRRASFRHPPIPRMSATFLLPGKETEQNLLQDMDSGLYVTRLGGGEVDPTTGDFVFQVTEGFRVRSGKIGHPIRGALLIGNGPQVLQSIAGVGADMELFPGYCGKEGQDVPVSDGQPALLIPDLIVGGE